jgi:TolB-like protein
MRSLLLFSLLVVGGGPVHRGPSAAAKKTVAVLAFDNNTGKSDYDHLGKGLSTMMTNDLASVDDIRVVERDRLADVTKEIDRQQTRYFDSTTAVKVGRLVGAEYIVTGAFIATDPQMRIDTRVIRVETGVIVKTATVTGKSDKFLDLEKRLARQLVKDLDIALTPEGDAKLEQHQQANSVDNVEDMARMSNAIDLSDRGDYANAAVKMAPLVSKYPNSIVVKMTYDAISKKAAAATKQKTKDKVNEKLGGLIRKKWPPTE